MRDGTDCSAVLMILDFVPLLILYHVTYSMSNMTFLSFLTATGHGG